MALLPSAFCVAEAENATRFGEILDALAGYTNYASPHVLSLIEEAEPLLDDPDVQTDYDEEQLALIPLYRHYFYRDCVLEEMKAKVKFYRYVRYTVSDEREYADREWDAIVVAYSDAVQAIDEADTQSEMEAIKDAFFAEIHTLPVYDEVFAAWEVVINEVVNGEISLLAAKVNDYRRGVGLPALDAPVFIVVTTENCVEEVKAFAEANLVDADSVTTTFTHALDDAIILGLYADKAEMEGVWESYRYAVNASTGYATPQEISLNNKKTAAVAALRQAIADSTYIQGLKDASDYKAYQELPNLMQHQLAAVEDEEEVDQVLADYMALLEPEAMIKPKAKMNSLTVAIIVLASVTAALFVAYFILRFVRGRAPKQDRVGAEQMLEELKRMAASKEEKIIDDATADAVKIAQEGGETEVEEQNNDSDATDAANQVETATIEDNASAEGDASDEEEDDK